MSAQPSSPAASIRSPEAATHLDENEQEPQQQPQQQPSSSPSAGTNTHPPFEPLFTLLSNTTSNTTVHPRVHYIFSDDEPTVLPPSQSILIDLEAATVKDDDSSGNANQSWAVKTASSLSPTFAITSAALEGEGILKIEGVQREPVSSSRHLGRSQDKDNLNKSKEGRGEDVDGLVDEFRRRMGVLRRVVEQGERSISPLVKEGLGRDDELQDNKEKQGGSVSRSAESAKDKDKTEES